MDLNQHIRHEGILASVPVPVKQHLPATTTCPFCRQETLRVFVSHLAGGRWYNCTGCGFKGDSIEFYRKAHDLSDIRDAIFELIAKELLPMSKDEATVSTINEYIQTYVNGRTLYTRLFSACRDELNSLDRHKSRLLNELGIWSGFNAGKWQEQLKTFVGLGSRDLFGSYGIKLPKKGYDAALVCPFYDVPGRISSFLVLGLGGKCKRIYTSIKGAPTDDGLMMLDALKSRNEVVYAVPDILFALHLQRRMANMSMAESLPLVVYGDKTGRAWHSVSTGRVIFWDHKHSYTLFDQSKRHPRAFIAKQPKYDPKHPDLLKNLSIAAVTTRMRNSAVSWATSMKQFILDGEFWKISEFMVNLELSATEIQRIYDVCTPSEKQEVQRVLGHTACDRIFYHGNMKISESDDGWWILRGTERELGCNAIIRIEEAVHVVDTKENFYEGVVIFKGQQIKFSTPVDVIEKRPSEWLRNLLMDHLGVLKLSKSIAPHLIEIAKQFHDPLYVRRVGKIGWNLDSRSFIFPNFSISDGASDASVHAKVINTDEVPAGNLPIPVPSEGDWDLALQADHPNAALWAGLACFMGNMLAPAVGVQLQPIGFVGGPGSIGCIVGEHIAKEMGMQTVVPRVMKHPLEEVSTMNDRHSYSVWLDTTSKGRKPVAYLQADQGADLMMHLMEGEAAALGVGETWVFINAPRILAQSKELPSLEGALAYLAWVQRNEFKMPMGSSWQQSVLQSLQDWAMVELHAADTAVFTMASKMLRTFDMDSLHQRLMHLIYWLLSNQRLRNDRKEFYADFQLGAEPQARGQVIFDEKAEKCYVKLSALRNVVGTTRLPAPDYNSAIRSFAAAQSTTEFEITSDGFIVGQKFWDSEVRRWRKIRT